MKSEILLLFKFCNLVRCCFSYPKETKRSIRVNITIAVMIVCSDSFLFDRIL